MFSLKQLSPTITDMIRFDHSHTMVTFHQYSRDKRPTVKKALADTICDALEIHATLEEEIFYPEMRRVIAELRRTSGSDPRHDDLVMELMRDVIHHVADEETKLLPQAEAIFSRQALSEMGARMTSRRMQLVGPKAGKLAKEHVVGFSGSTAAMVVGLASALFAAKALGPKKPWKSNPV